MPKQIFLMRHGKAADYFEYPDDFMRPLVDRGQLESLAATKKLANQFTVDYIVCSPAVRTMQTARIALLACKLPLTQLIVVPQLYMGSFGEYLDAINGLNSKNNLLIIGHNPTIGQMAIHYGLNQSGFKTSEIFGFEAVQNVELHSKTTQLFAHLRG